LFIFGFWGHGFRPSSGRHYLCGLDTSPDDLERSAIHLDVIKAKLCQIGARDTVIMLDSCQNRPPVVDRSGEVGVLEQGATKALGDVARDISVKSSSPNFAKTVAVLMACSEGQRAYEWKDRQHGIFTAHVLDGLKNGFLSLSQLTSHIADKVPGTARRLFGTRQVPFCEIKGGKADINLRSALVSRPQTHAPPSSPPPPMNQKRWHWHNESGTHGPHSLKELEDLARSGEIRKDSHVWEPGMDEWCMVAHFPRLARLVSSTPFAMPISSASLIYREKDGRRHNIVICGGSSFGFGRDITHPQVDIQLRPSTEECTEAHRFISRYHFRIQLHEHYWLVRLPHSSPTNELLVNNTPVRDPVVLDQRTNTLAVGDVMKLSVDICSPEYARSVSPQDPAGDFLPTSDRSRSTCCIVSYSGQESGYKEERYVLVAERAAIGSRPDNAAFFATDGFNPLHAAMVWHDNKLWIQRMAESGILRLNDQNVAPDDLTPISHGDRLEIGNLKTRIVPKRFFGQ